MTLLPAMLETTVFASVAATKVVPSPLSILLLVVAVAKNLMSIASLVSGASEKVIRLPVTEYADPGI